jgi:hypothetical protein
VSCTRVMAGVLATAGLPLTSMESAPVLVVTSSKTAKSKGVMGNGLFNFAQ